MSSGHDSHGSSGGKTLIEDIKSIAAPINDFMSPRENVVAKTIVQISGETVGKIWSALKGVADLTLQAPFAAVEAVGAMANNTLGWIHQTTDKAIIQNMNAARASVHHIINEPSSLFAPAAASAAAHGGAHAVEHH